MNFKLELSADIISVQLKPSGEVKISLTMPISTELWSFLGRNTGQTINLGMSSAQLEFAEVEEKPEPATAPYKIVKLGTVDKPATNDEIQERRAEILNESAPPAQSEETLNAVDIPDKPRRGRKSKATEKEAVVEQLLRTETIIKPASELDFDSMLHAAPEEPKGPSEFDAELEELANMKIPTQAELDAADLAELFGEDT